MISENIHDRCSANRCVNTSKKIDIYDIVEKRVSAQVFTGPSLTIDINRWSVGDYNYVVTSKGLKPFASKFVKMD